MEPIFVYIIILSISALLSYLLGSLNFSFIIPKAARNIDIRETGSKNAGATNVTRTLGKRFGLICAVADIFKGSMAVAISFIVYLLFTGASKGADIAMYCGGFFAVLGHVFPIYYKFKGGKGVATFGGALIALDYRQAAILLGIFLFIILITKMVSLASVIGVSFYIPLTILFAVFGGKYTVASLVSNIFFALFCASLVIYKHRENLERISNGTERKIGEGNPHDKGKSTIF